MKYYANSIQRGFLFVGHWLKGDLGEDRKDVGMMIKTFCTVFKDVPKKQQPGMILKTSAAGFSVMDREEIVKKIKEITEPFADKCPPINLLFGDLTENQMSSLYHHPKVKTMVSLTHGEGYGRPLQEATMVGLLRKKLIKIMPNRQWKSNNQLNIE